jgi:uncharacterized damage-inducible protein DinB
VAQGKDLPGLAAARARWEEVEGDRSTWLGSFAAARLDEFVSIKPTTGGEYRHSFREMFRHVIDHSSYHRGQIITLLRQLGVQPPNTGMIVFFRKRSPQTL